MQRKIVLNLIVVSLCGFLVTTIALYAIQTMMARNTADETFTLRLENVAEHMKQNERQIENLIATTKEDYISRARALAMMIELEPNIVKDKERLDQVAASLNVDELHIIDGDGVLRWGTHPEYYGMDFATTDQTRPFLDILEDPTKEIAQDPMPNGSVGLMRQYAGVSLRNAKGIAQIGMVPERLEEALQNNQICNVLSEATVGNTGYVFALYTDSGVIASHPNQKLIGALLPDALKETGYLTIDGQRVLYKTLKVNEYTLVAVIPTPELYAWRSFYVIIFMSFMVVLFTAFCIIVSTYIKKRVINGISETVKTLDMISNGNLNVTANIRSNTEFERLSDGINHMLQSIKNKMSKITSLAGDLRRFGAIVAIADAGIIVKDEKGIVLEWNIGAENIIGYKPDEIVGKTTKAYAPEVAHAGIDDIEERLKKGEHIAHLEVLRRHKDGRLIDCSASYTPIFDDDGLYSGSVAIFHDISDKKQIEQSLHEAVLAAEQANKAKTSFLANMSHEIRTPLNGIIGFAELAMDDDVPSKTKDYLQKIMVSGNGLLQIINDILDISKIEAGKMVLENIPFYIYEVLELCETISSPKADEKGILLYFYTEPPITGKVLGDPTKLRQILLNLLSNAIKFTKRGIVKMIATVKEANEESTSVLFEVVDNGIGMSSDQIQKIFEPFTQGDSTTTRKYGGTGLGLAITKNMIELMGGELKVESTLGVGSKFSFTIRFESTTSQDDVPIHYERHTENSKKPIFAGDVLVCEDNEINQQVIHGHLSKVGLHTTIVDNGKLAVEAVKKKEGKPYDLIFMDIHMPVMDGLEASRKLQEIGNQTPIIALTANAMSKDKATYLKSGMSDYLAKPFVARELWTCLLKYLNPIVEMDREIADTPNENSNPTQTDVVVDRESGLEQCGGDEELYHKLLVHFLQDNISTYKLLKDALDNEDVELAYRIAHTLKGVAGTIGANLLQKAAQDFETELSKGRLHVNENISHNLKNQLNTVFNELAFLASDEDAACECPESFDGEKAKALVQQISPLIESCNMQCLDFIPDIKRTLSPIGGIVNILIKEMEDCDFELALETLEQIKRLL